MVVMFVGGPKDGERRDWAEPLRQFVRVDVFAGRPDGTWFVRDAVRVETYRLEFASVGNIGGPVYVHDRLTNEAAMAMLLEGYQPKEAPK